MDLWKTSGHYDFYRENMFDQMDIEEEQYQLRPMCAPCLDSLCSELRQGPPSLRPARISLFRQGCG